MNFKRGDIVLCKVPMPSDEFREFKMRPGLVVSKNMNNQRLNDVIIAICTSNISSRQEPTQYLIEGEEIIQAGIKVPSVVKCETLLTINKTMIMKILGSLSQKAMDKIKVCLTDSLALELSKVNEH